ncbi:MAG: hypothetical protein OEL81_03085 [Nitrosopumilus sp.]|nr:hypothetical protein [Nitrosopumilus sp.]
MGKPSKSDNELLQEISKKLDKLTCILATQGKDLDTQITILQGFDWEWDEIGRFVGMKGDAARMRYNRKK